MTRWTLQAVAELSVAPVELEAEVEPNSVEAIVLRRRHRGEAVHIVVKPLQPPAPRIPQLTDIHQERRFQVAGRAVRMTSSREIRRTDEKQVWTFLPPQAIELCMNVTRRKALGALVSPSVNDF